MKDKIEVYGIEITWDTSKGICTCAGLPVALMWTDSTLGGLLKGMQSMVGTPRLCLALQAEGRKSVEDDWNVISQFPDFEKGFEAIAQVATAAGWGVWQLVAIDYQNKRCKVRVSNSWEGKYQKSLNEDWGSSYLAGKLAGYCSRLFNTNCWADQELFMAKGDEYDEFIVSPSPRNIEVEIENLLSTDEATRADMAVALEKLSKEIEERKRISEERIQLETKIQHAQKLESLGVLSGGIAHDFNNLLVSILGNAELGLDSEETTPKIEKFFADIKRTSERAADLCQQLLAYSGKGKFLLSAMNLTEEVKKFDQMLFLSSSNKTEVQYNLDENLPYIEADNTQIRQVIMNLMTNASEAISGANGVIKISTGVGLCCNSNANIVHGEDCMGLECVFLEVEDNGSGMDTNMIDRIFDPFYTTKFTGRGLGMAAVLGIIRGHKGAIEITSALGEGSTFRVSFPIINQEQLSNHTSIEPNNIECNLSGTVLLVDDEEDVRETAQLLLETIGFNVLTASSGQEAFKTFTENSSTIDLVLCDLTMPQMNGIELHEMLEQQFGTFCMVIASGYNEEEISDQFLQSGISGFIQKPYTLSTLEQILQKAINTKELR